MHSLTYRYKPLRLLMEYSYMRIINRGMSDYIRAGPPISVTNMMTWIYNIFITLNGVTHAHQRRENKTGASFWLPGSREPGILKNSKMLLKSKKNNFLYTDTYRCSLRICKISLNTMIICSLHKKDNNPAQNYQNRNPFCSMYLFVLYTPHINTYVTGN